MSKQLLEEIRVHGSKVLRLLAEGLEVPIAIQVCTCGFRAYVKEDLEHFSIKCKVRRICSCGTEIKDSYSLCTDCLGRSIEGTIIPQWHYKGVTFRIIGKNLDKTFSSIRSASIELKAPYSSLHNLVSGKWKTYRGYKVEVIAQPKDFTDITWRKL